MEWPVWYHTEVKQIGVGYKTGTLTVEPSGARLETDDGTIEIAPIRSVGRERVSLWLYWVAVEYGDEGNPQHLYDEGNPQHLYMGDRRLLGWRGMLGSNNEIEKAMHEANVGAAT